LPEELDELGQLVVRVQAARTGKHPHFGAFQGLGLHAERRLGATEGGTVRAEPYERHRARPKAADLRSKFLSSKNQFGRGQLVGSRGPPVHEVGQAVAELQKPFVFRRMKPVWRESRGMQRGPETVAGTREMKAGGGGIQSGIDAAEQDLEARADDVAQALAGGGLQLSPARRAAPRSRRIFRRLRA
jgi:hypothetical protein